jgi:hypothetical protein
VAASDPDGDVLTLSAIDLPDWMSLIDNGDGTGRLVGVPSEAGEISVSLAASDGELEHTQSFAIAITYVPPPPTPVSIAGPTSGSELALFSEREPIRITWLPSQAALGGPITYQWVASLSADFTDLLLSAETVSTEHIVDAGVFDNALASANVFQDEAVTVYHRVVAGVASPQWHLATIGPVSTLRVVRASTARTERSGFATEFSIRGAYPNPVSDATLRIAFDLPSPAEVTVEVYDGMGRSVIRVDTGPHGPGIGREVIVPVGELEAGAFMYRLRASYLEGPAQIASGKIRVVR